MPITRNIVKQFGAAVACLLLLALWTEMALAAPAPLSIKSAVYNKKSASLIVKTHIKDPGGLLTLLHSKGGVLGQTQKSDDTFTIPLSQLGDVPCQVEARLGEFKISKSVAGAGAECSKVPTCKILPFAKNTKPELNKAFTFQAQVAIKDKKAAPLTVEWDFAGGVMGHPYQKLLKAENKPILSGKVSQPATFVRDNSRYHVRFAASDALGRRCEASVYVDIGTPPIGQTDTVPLAQAAQQTQPARASGLQGDNVVLPFEKRSLQCGHESTLLPYAPFAYPSPVNTINAYVYQKGLRPIPLSNNQIDLTYSAGSNPADPVGPNSINSTSQNWPLNTPMADASIQKGQLFEHYVRPPGSVLADDYVSYSLLPETDVGAFNLYLTIPINVDHGRYMPGIAMPYSANDAQAFSDFVAGDNWFSAYWLPLTDIDDSGRVNPTSVFRVQAMEAGTQTVVAATDTVLASGKDFHCRECHSLGKLGANPNIDRVNQAGDKSVMWMSATGTTVPDQEHAALQNAGMLHAYYDADGMSGMMIEMVTMGGNMHGEPIHTDGPGASCGGEPGMCHSQGDYDSGRIRRQAPLERGNMSMAMHRLHGALQYNDQKTDILRDANGRYKCAMDPTKNGCLDPSKSLFPVKDPITGKILPMEENCLKCHSGQREQCYRDRMFTAGVTCYQCHGDMLAVAQMFEKSHLNPDGNTHRLEGLDQPDCGSCHTGSGNRGKDGKNGFFSAGVKNLAFDENDPSATPNAVDLTNPDQRRFAVLPLTELHPETTFDYNAVLKTPLYRMGKDIHGQVACAACHGAAHSVWPNRDPNANDNVTSLELQGHTGSVLECNVCHKPDSFAKFEDIDDGLKVIDRKDNVLGGPHSLHPINDPYWWKSAPGDTDNTDGSTSGGWHNDYAKLPGKAGEDQCAACHGNDHLGTRLSKTPVDRTFDFTDLPDQALLKKAGIKTKVTVKAGTPIGCNTCHSVKLSCTNKVNSDCGKTSDHVTGSDNQAPTVTPPYVINATVGEDLNYTLSATDPEDDTPVFSLAGGIKDMTLDAGGALTVASGHFQEWIQRIQEQAELSIDMPYATSPFDHDFKVVVSDNNGAYRIQPLTIHLDCPAGLTWDNYSYACMPLAITSKPPYGGFDAGTVWHYQVLAKSGSQLPLTYALAEPVPAGMSIDDQGYITWDTSKILATDDIFGTIKVSDTAGNEAALDFYKTVCISPMHWNSDSYSCSGTVQFTSTVPWATSANHFTFQVTATDASHQPISFSLLDAPSDMSISADGLINWDPRPALISGQYQAIFQIQASVAPDNWTRQTVYLSICPGETPYFDPAQQNCVPGALQITSIPDSTASAHQDYHYQVTTTAASDTGMSYALYDAPAGMTIDGNGLVSWNTSGFEESYITYSITATDSQDNWVQQHVAVSICPGNNPIWDSTQGICTPGILQITSTPDTMASAHQDYRYQVTTIPAIDANLSLVLKGAPTGMTIDANGLVSWNTSNFAPGQYIDYRIEASDNQGEWVQQYVGITLCSGDTPIYDPTQTSCVSGPIQFTSIPEFGASANKVFQYQVNTSNANNMPVSVSLDGAPNGMTIDGNGLVSWDATGAEGLFFEFRITATDTLGAWTQQSVNFNICNADAPNWDSVQKVCIP